MITPAFFVSSLKRHGIDFYAGVPDSLLKNLCAYLADHLDAAHNIIAANEGGAVGLAAGYHLATGRIPAVYMQNSGEGNAVNPLASLTDGDVYRIPLLLVIGWRGEPGIKDEPQHKKQGKITLPLLEVMGIPYAVLSDREDEAARQLDEAARRIGETGEAYALVVRKDTFDTYKLAGRTDPQFPLGREEAIRTVAASLDAADAVVSTTGMISRELFEYRESAGQGHGRDFLTVGSMGHASQIALGIALEQPDRRVCCFDGDGAVLMHMGSLAITGSLKPRNYLHVVFNNGAHDSVGGQPTVGLAIDLPAIAIASGYRKALAVSTKEELEKALAAIPDEEGPLLLEIKVRKGNRKELGRPTTTPIDNKLGFMDFMQRK
ncbi:MAG: phosphonopyruvate decarboxylase [Rikenellaceae bacterium]|nr:phosphonopyruvate decarboxylase [Rikenellaceae bacterium]